MSENTFTRVLVVIDGSDAARRALEAALRLCRETGASLVVLARGEHMPKYGALIAEVEDAKRARDKVLAMTLDEASVFASYSDLAIVTYTSPDSSWHRIVDYAVKNESDLIVIGYRPSLLGEWRFGSTIGRLVKRAPCPVLVVGALGRTTSS